MMESRNIAEALERLYPNPPLHFDSPYQARIDTLMDKMLLPIRPIFVPLVPQIFLNPASQAYFVPSREKAVGTSLAKYGEGADTGFEKAKPYFKELGEMLRENPEGPFLQGKEPVYADLVVVGWLRMLDGLGWAGTVFDCEGGAEIKKLYEAAAKWLERDSH